MPPSADGTRVDLLRSLRFAAFLELMAMGEVGELEQRFAVG